MRPITLCAVALLLLSAVSDAWGEQGSYALVRSSYSSDSPLEYRSLFLSSTLHWEPNGDTAVHLALQKGSGEPGYYPAGHFVDSEWGIYEKGSYYLSIENRGALEKFVLGNYSPGFGLGLLFGSTYPLILSNPYYDLARYRDGVYPSSSPSKAGVLEGAAFELGIGGMLVRPFISWNSYDCSAGESDYYLYNDNDGDEEANDVDDDDFTGIRDGFPRRYSSKTELFNSIRGEPEYDGSSSRLKRNNLTEYVAGLNLSRNGDTLRYGGTIAYGRFNRLVDPYYNFDPGGGNKTGHYFRGKDYLASSLYFKSYGRLELFGEAVGSYHRQLSYYEEFYGDPSAAVGFAGGFRARREHGGLVAWGAYLPAHLVNPHGQELPEGPNNLACGLLGFHWARRPKSVDGWVYVHRELYDEDDAANPELGVSLAGKYSNRLWGETSLESKQELELIDNYYYAPGERSWKLSSKLAVRTRLWTASSLAFSLENRLGGAVAGRTSAGAGGAVELLTRKEHATTAVSVMLYTSEGGGFATLYPYDRPLNGWGSFSPSISGRGIFGYVSADRTLHNDLTIGGKVRYIYDLREPARREAKVYVLSELSF